MSKDEVIAECNLSDEEFDQFYSTILDQIRQFGTHGIEVMLKFAEQELAAGNEVL